MEPVEMLLANLETNIRASIDAGLDSAQLLIAQSETILHHQAYGNATCQTMYDIASLTKIFATTYLYQYYAQTAALDLNLTLAEIFPTQFANDQFTDKAHITLRMLLAHEAGFEPNPLFYDANYNPALFCQNRAEFLPKLLSAPLIHTPGTQSLYSDVDFMLLTFALEHLYGAPFDLLWQQAFPMLKHERITFTPLAHGYSHDDIAPTELHGNTRDHTIDFANVRTHTVHGEVQDEKAFHCMAGISGHAGLFANCQALYQALQLMTAPQPFFMPEIQQQFVHSQQHDPSFGLGWRLNLGGDMQYHFGQFASDRAYGHTGWTGCVCVIDPQYDLTILYLTNRKHSKVLKPRDNPYRFLGDILWAGQYRNIINEIYTALGLTACN